MASTILLIHCQDEPGLIYKITGVIYNHNLNVISNGAFVEKTFNHFFMRTEFSGQFDQRRFLEALHAILPATASVKLSVQQARDICILVTKEHHCLSDLLIRHAFGELQANIKCVISNYQNLEDLTSKFSIPFHYVTHEDKSRDEHEKEVLAV